MAAPSQAPSAAPDCPSIGNGPPLAVFPGMAPGPVTIPRKFLPLAHATQRTIHVINRPSGLPRGISMPDLAARHARTLAANFSRHVDLFGASTGGAIALQLAVDHPHLVHRLIIVTAASWLGHEGREKLRQYGEEIAQGRSGARILASVLASPRTEWLMATTLWFSHRLERGKRPIPRPTRIDDMLATIDAEVAFDVTPRLGEIRSPTLLIAGAHDRAFPLPLVQTTAAGIPNSRLIVTPRPAT
jgi:pimeloyl-ACP methyl ester carboxylesterase